MSARWSAGQPRPSSGVARCVLSSPCPRPREAQQACCTGGVSLLTSAYVCMGRTSILPAPPAHALKTHGLRLVRPSIRGRNIAKMQAHPGPPEPKRARGRQRHLGSLPLPVPSRPPARPLQRAMARSTALGPCWPVITEKHGDPALAHERRVPRPARQASPAGRRGNAPAPPSDDAWMYTVTGKRVSGAVRGVDKLGRLRYKPYHRVRAAPSTARQGAARQLTTFAARRMAGSFSGMTFGSTWPSTSTSTPATGRA